MADPTYVVPTNPVYNPQIRKLQNSDPANANTVFNPLVEKLIENTHAVKLSSDSKGSVSREATLASSSWSGSAAPYTQTVSVAGVTSASNGLVDVSSSATDAQWAAAQDAEIRKSGQGTGTMTFKAYGDKPTVNIPITVVIWG